MRPREPRRGVVGGRLCEKSKRRRMLRTMRLEFCLECYVWGGSVCSFLCHFIKSKCPRLLSALCAFHFHAYRGRKDMWSAYAICAPLTGTAKYACRQRSCARPRRFLVPRWTKSSLTIRHPPTGIITLYGAGSVVDSNPSPDPPKTLEHTSTPVPSSTETSILRKVPEPSLST